MPSKSKGHVLNTIKRTFTRRVGSNQLKNDLKSLRSKLRENQATRKRNQEIAEKKAADKAIANARARQVAYNIMSRRGSRPVTRGVQVVVENTKHRVTQSQKNNPTKLAPGWRRSRMTSNVASKLGVRAVQLIPYSDFSRMSRKERAIYLSQYPPHVRSYYSGHINTPI